MKAFGGELVGVSSFVDDGIFLYESAIVVGKLRGGKLSGFRRPRRYFSVLSNILSGERGLKLILYIEVWSLFV